MGKKKKRHINLMRDWPSDETCGVAYEDLIFPLKKVIHDGYRLERNNITQFTYTGYNIGEAEREVYFPTPEERFSTRWLEHETKFKRTLLDNVLITAFQLGIEQGRRLSAPQRYSNQLLEDLLYARTQTIKRLREKLAKYDSSYEESPPIPLESDDNELLIENMEELEPDNVDV